MNQANDRTWSSIRLGISRFSEIRAYEIRPDRARDEESATGSMNRSLTEEGEGKEGRAHGIGNCIALAAAVKRTPTPGR